MLRVLLMLMYGRSRCDDRIQHRLLLQRQQSLSMRRLISSTSNSRRSGCGGRGSSTGSRGSGGRAEACRGMHIHRRRLRGVSVDIRRTVRVLATVSNCMTVGVAVSSGVTVGNVVTVGRRCSVCVRRQALLMLLLLLLSLGRLLRLLKLLRLWCMVIVVRMRVCGWRSLQQDIRLQWLQRRLLLLLQLRLCLSLSLNPCLGL